MSNFTAPPAPNYLPAAPTPPKKQAWWKKPIVVLPVATLALGLGLGANNRPDPVVNTVTVEKPVEKIVEVTPQSCLTALELNETAFSYLSDSLTSITEMDYTAAGSSTGKVEALVPKVNAAKSECRAAAK
jgi:hypothetical protein